MPRLWRFPSVRPSSSPRQTASFLSMSLPNWPLSSPPLPSLIGLNAFGGAGVQSVGRPLFFHVFRSRQSLSFGS